MTLPTLDALNAMPADEFTAALGAVFEHADWVAAAAANTRPHASVAALHGAMMQAVRSAPEPVLLAFLRGHPELAGPPARAGTIAADSAAEQSSLALNQGVDDEIAALNAAYAARFGFPFILCVRRHTRNSLMAQFRRRVTADPAAERAAALTEIGHITRLRLADRIAGAAVAQGWLSTHVLDTARGCAAPGVPVEVSEPGGPVLAAAVTNADGRTDAPLLAKGQLRIGVYELRFTVGRYFSAGETPFLDVVPVRFGVADPQAHYHVPLLVSPGAFSSYRGS